jgi:Niemann-Pick C2 protein
LENSVFGNILGVPLPFIGVDGTDACPQIYDAEGEKKVGCPLKAGETYIYKNNINVLEIYPRVSILVQPKNI